MSDPADVDKAALFATIQKLLQLQADMAARNADRERWHVEARVREEQHRQQLDTLRREFVDTLQLLRKQLGLPDLVQTVQETLKSVIDMDVFKGFNDLFGDFFKKAS